MKTTLLALLMFLPLICNSQKNANQVKNTDLKNLVGSIKDFKNYQLNDKSINILVCNNESGSAKQEGTDEVTDRIYISVCEYGEASECQLYVVESTLNVSIEKVSESKSSVSIIINYGSYGKKKSDTIVIPYTKN
ncbi:MAG: hypothetical protein PSV16_02070 [Flavobacterium sp.]|nr:hypothetical protein [Flavobacterium sp.]